MTLERLEDRTVPVAGALDPTFGAGGHVLLDFLGSGNESASDLAVVQPDGKIVVVGTATYQATVVRYNPNGSLDSSFGSGGHVEFGQFSAGSIALQGDGKIVLAGTRYQPNTGNDFTIARLTSSGALDLSFDGDGFATVDFGPDYDSATAVAVQVDGKIVVAGTTYQPATGYDFAVARLNADGGLDSTFDGDGRATIDFASSYDIGSDVAIQADGRIVVAVSSYQGGATATDFAVARLNADGSLDATFDGDGRATIDFSAGYDSAAGVAVQADGKVVLAGSTYSALTGSIEHFALARLNTDGSLDTGFGAGGRVTLNFGPYADTSSGFTIQTDGRIVITGSAYQPATGYDFAVARLNADGSLDSTFDGDGRTTVDFPGSYHNWATAMAVQADGKVVVAGYSQQPDTGQDIALARLNADGSLDGTFDGDGRVLTDFVNVPSYDHVQAIAVQPDGKIVSLITSNGLYTGSRRMFVVRQNADGSLDNNFGTNGRAEVSPGGLYGYLNALVVGPDGKIVLAGYSYQGGEAGWDFTVLRLNSNGTMDTSLDADGQATIDFGSALDLANAVAVQSDGRIVVAGSSKQGATFDDFAVARLNSDGSLDSTFCGDGRVTIDFGTSSDVAWGVVVGTDGRIVIAGWAADWNSDAGFDFAVARLNTDGSLDTGFNGNGWATADFGSRTDQAVGVAVLADGRVVVAGYSYQDQGYDFAVARFNADGSLDTSFDGDGRALVDFGSWGDYAYAVAVQADGKVVLAGVSYQDATGGDIALARLNADGSLDTGFNGTGKVLSDFGPADIGNNEDGVQAMALQADGKIVVGGWSYQGPIYEGGTDFDAIILRYQVGASGYAVLSGSDLIVYGTDANDDIRFSTSDGQVVVTLNGSTLGSFSSASVSRLVAHGQGGDDDIEVAGNITKPAWLYGEGGNDRLKGGAGHDVLIAGDGDDLLVGGSGRDLPVGGRGADRLVGNADDDILIAGFTTYDANLTALAAIMAEWTSGRSYSQRVYNLSNGTIAGTDGSKFGSRANGGYYLTVNGSGATLLDDNAQDILTGSAGQDWFLFNADGENGTTRDRVTDLSASEFSVDLDWIMSDV